VEAGDSLASWHEQKYIEAEKGGRITCKDRHITVVHEIRNEREHEVPTTSRLLVEEGQRIEPGTQLIEGVKNPHDILRVMGREATEQYLLSEVQKVYRSQGVNINDKHFEVIFRKVLSKVQITDSGDTNLLPRELVDRLVLEDVNQKVVEAGGRPAKGWPVLLGITKAALNTESFLSAASFQHTIRVLSSAAIEGKEDPLLGLKENVIIGKLVPAGTGYRGDNPYSDGPVDEYEGIRLRPSLAARTEEQEKEQEEETEEKPTDEAQEESEATEAAESVKTTEILGIVTPA